MSPLVPPIATLFVDVTGRSNSVALFHAQFASLDPPVTGQFEPFERQTLVPPIVVFDERDVMPLVVRFAATIEEAYKFVEVEFVDVVFVKIAVAAVERPIEVPLIEPPLIVAKPSVALFAFKFVVVTTPEI